MSSWIAYSVYPVDGVELDGLQSCLIDSVTDAAVEASRFGRERIEPQCVEAWGCVGRKCSTSTNTNPTLESELVMWFEACSDLIDVAFLVQMSDTSDFGTLRAYKPSEYGLVEVENRSGEYRRDQEILKEHDEYFPEEAAKLDSQDDGTDHIHELESEFGHRPLIFYG